MLPGRYILQPEVMRVLDAHGEGRRRRDPADRRDGAADRHPALPRPTPSTASATIAATRPASSSPTSLWACADDDVAPGDPRLSRRRMHDLHGHPGRRRAGPPRHRRGSSRLSGPRLHLDPCRKRRRRRSSPCSIRADIPDVAANALVATETRPRCDRIERGRDRQPARPGGDRDSTIADRLVSIRMWARRGQGRFG